MTKVLDHQPIQTEIDTMETAASSSEEMVFRSKRYLQALVALIEEFQRTHCPIPQPRRDEIIETYYKKGTAATIMVQMRRLGDLTADEGQRIGAVQVVPRFEGRIYIETQTQIVRFPLEYTGRTIQDLNEELGGRLDIPEDIPEDDLTESSEAQIETGTHKPYQIAEGAYVLPTNAFPRRMGGMRRQVYLAIIVLSRQTAHCALQPTDLSRICQELQIQSPGSMIQSFEREVRLLMQIEGKPEKGRYLRAIIFSPYLDESGQTVIPEECHRYPNELGSQELGIEQAQQEDGLPLLPLIRSRNELQDELDTLFVHMKTMEAKHIADVLERKKRQQKLREKIDELQRTIDEHRQLITTLDPETLQAGFDASIYKLRNRGAKIQHLISMFDDGTIEELLFRH